MKTTNREKYLFEDFTFSNYRRLVALTLEQGFQFILHRDEFVPDRKDVIWRHDVEFSPDKALRMAEIEHDEGVVSTYFWQLHTDYYNTVSPYFLPILKEIRSLGHHIGLHFDSHFWDVQNEDELNRYVRLDAEYLEAAMRHAGIDEPIDTFSFHNTNDFTMSCEDDTYGGLVNVYSRTLREKYSYCGDSTGIWRFDRLEDRLLDPSIRHLHVLTHDGMWSESAMSPHSRIMGCIQAEADRQKFEYATKLPETGNINVGELSINPGVDER